MALHVDKKGAPALSVRADRIKKGEPGIRLANSRSADALVMRSIKVQKKRYVKIEFMNSIHLRMICACCVATALLLLLPTVSASAPKQSGYSKHDAAGEEVIPPEKRAELEHYTLKIGPKNVITQAAPYSNQYDPLYRSIWLRGKGFDQQLSHFIRKGRELGKNRTLSDKERLTQFERIGLGILDSIGFRTPSCLSLRIDTNELKKDGKDPSEIINDYGSFVFQEYCNQTPIEGARAVILFRRGRLDEVVLRTVSPVNPIVTSETPSLSLQQAVQRYLSTSSLKLSGEPTGRLCYEALIQNGINLILCWRVSFSAMSDSRDVWIDATTGKVVCALSTVREAHTSGTVRDSD